MYILVAIWGYLTKKYIYISFHGEEIRKVKNSFFYKKIAFIFNAVFCISKPLLDELKKIHSQPIFYIGNGIDDKEFVDLSLVKKKQILFVAKFKKVKRHKLIIDGFAKFISNKQFSDYQLLLVGDGDLFDEIMTYVENNKFNNVNFLGNKTSSELVKIYNESEVFALTSEREGFPKVILEAIACDCKIVSTKVGSLDDVLGKDYPFFILSDKPDDVSRILTKSVKNDFKIDRDKILKKFNWEGIRNKYLNIYMNDLNDKI